MSPDAAALTRRIGEQRWFGSKSRAPVRGRTADECRLGGDCALALFEVELSDGERELYQVPYRAGDDAAEAVIDLADPQLAHALLAALRASQPLAAREGRVEFELTGALLPAAEPAGVRPPGGEQSNSSVVFGERAILKAYRRLVPGENPELEALRFLGARGFAHTPALLGSYRYAGTSCEATLGILQAFVPAARDGWTCALASFAQPGAFLARLRRLGEVTASMHAAFASETTDPAFAPASLGGDGWAIRGHGDYHLGQVLWAGGDWLVIDFEGEPARSLPERRRKTSPLRDVACMLRSLAYAAEAGAGGADWEATARAEFLSGYLDAADGALLPRSSAEGERLLALFELEKAFAELHYELDNRPAWAHIPAAGILRLLGRA